MPKNYYDVLGVSKSSSKEDIKKAFHKLAHKYHPDKKGGDEAKFKEINEAYQTLSDDRKRQQYDAYGSTGPGGGFGGNGAGGFDFSGFSPFGGSAEGRQGGQGFEFDFGDIFSQFFGGENGGRGGARMKRGRDISVDIQITFAEAIFGVTREILINKVGVCDTCGGKGAKPGSKMKKCDTCNSKGQIHETRQSFLGTFSTARECPKCHGRGEVPEELCQDCGGAGVKKKSQAIKVVIPPGIDNGEMIRMSNQGEAVTGGVSGDLYVRIHVETSKIFKREGANLVMELSVKLSDAILGAEYEVETLDGQLKVKIPAGISYGELLRVKEKGIPTKSGLPAARYGRRGDLLLRVVIKTPTKLSKKAREAIDKLREEGL